MSSLVHNEHRHTQFNGRHEPRIYLLTIPGRRTSSSGTRTHRTAAWWGGAAACSWYPPPAPHSCGPLGSGFPRTLRPAADPSPFRSICTQCRIFLCKEIVLQSNCFWININWHTCPIHGSGRTSLRDLCRARFSQCGRRTGTHSLKQIYWFIKINRGFCRNINNSRYWPRNWSGGGVGEANLIRGAAVNNVFCHRILWYFRVPFKRRWKNVCISGGGQTTWPLGHLALCCFIHGSVAINIESFKNKLHECFFENPILVFLKNKYGTEFVLVIQKMCLIVKESILLHLCMMFCLLHMSP